jgi:hypothetical protein
MLLHTLFSNGCEFGHMQYETRNLEPTEAGGHFPPWRQPTCIAHVQQAGTEDTNFYIKIGTAPPEHKATNRSHLHS